MDSPYFSLKGKINRRSYALFGVVVPSIFFFASYTSTLLVNNHLFSLSAGIGEIADYLILFLTAGLVLAPTVKRLHDVGLSGWFCVSVFIPNLGLIPMVLLVFWPGKSTECSESAEGGKL
ncbi:DUF805 domain-containing protein [Microbulbifer hydrolyticus]|uniref:DUF805 domain-containing protein n=1 Tax=Microbulbifer hydrolyticus TaxID=48074 RepID=A0A6P1TD91_9GAMM|nr:DUF805 domain-containing protein [Microbulbifer hydrolyticus]MBB5213120.1 uncharacterized membrane protein YhaH (DUF805 family) [Microbulbifer hydrolyticus]MBB5213245.1 uncharacterized membrane protein YhaH (DUF805 family) [Microbulbifer hydrolyticus]QHQ38495.1 DUF805 domain-containing protein [Microbulbifer hydrolyticus]QHQ38672.1 DUF805 domain-containing protein [Microbulbifer hydrolyticus]